MKLFVNKVNVIIEQELPNGRTYAVVAMTMGKYNQQAVELNVYNWSGEVRIVSILLCIICIHHGNI